MPHPAYAGSSKPGFELVEGVAHRDEPEVSILLFEVQKRLAEVVDRRAPVALEDGVYQLASYRGVVCADTFEVGHAFRAELLYDLLVVHALGRSAHRVADETSHKAAVDLVG